MMNMKSKRLGPCNHWIKASLIIRNLRTISLGLILSNVLLVGTMIYLMNQKNLVIALTESESLYFIGERKEVELQESDLKKAAKRFVLERYQWKSYNMENIMRNISPYASYSLLKKVLQQIKDSKEFIKKNSISQDVVIQNIEAKDGYVHVEIDRVISLGKRVKSVQPLKIHLELMRDKPNKWNPKGIYISAIKEFNK